MANLAGTFFGPAARLWSALKKANRGASAGRVQGVVLHDPDAHKPKNLDDPFHDPAAQERIGDLRRRGAKILGNVMHFHSSPKMLVSAGRNRRPQGPLQSRGAGFRMEVWSGGQRQKQWEQRCATQSRDIVMAHGRMRWAS